MVSRWPVRRSEYPAGQGNDWRGHHPIPLAAGEKARPYIQTSGNEFAPSISPDGNWLAYTSDETKRQEVYVQSFPVPGRKYQVSVNGGLVSGWSRDGKELYFISPDRKMMAVPVTRNGSNLEMEKATALFDSRFGGGFENGFDVSNDGRFLIPVRDVNPILPFTLVVNWQGSLGKYVRKTGSELASERFDPLLR